ncbi:hypothetical protein BDV93DRAFT_558320 [Ceratobasidium sp. AG-I]|nr:hypothetical protein BDV93DRAFT_558320 [Ceratobasidium sp. AG-I]
MTNLTTTEGTLAYLEATRFAATKVCLLTGGHSAFTYRAILKTPLPTGETTVIIKHYEGYIAVHETAKIEAERSVFEYEALVALAGSGLFDSESVVQVPKPIYYDAGTNTIFMTDLGEVDTLTKVFSESLEGAHADRTRLEEAYSLASEIGTAIGDFMGRYHAWTALPAQSALRERFLGNVAAREQCMGFHLITMVMSADKFGVKEPWIESIVQEEREEALSCGKVLAVGDMWLDNVVVSRAHGGLRLYIIDWEMARPTRPKFDIGELTGVALSFTRKHGVQDSYPFIPALHQAYCRHQTLDPLRIARASGIDAMGFGTVLPWAKNGKEEFLKEVTMSGFELLRLSHSGDVESIKSKSVLKHLFGSESQQVI